MVIDGHIITHDSSKKLIKEEEYVLDPNTGFGFISSKNTLNSLEEKRGISISIHRTIDRYGLFETFEKYHCKNLHIFHPEKGLLTSNEIPSNADYSKTIIRKGIFVIEGEEITYDRGDFHVPETVIEQFVDEVIPRVVDYQD